MIFPGGEGGWRWTACCRKCSLLLSLALTSAHCLHLRHSLLCKPLAAKMAQAPQVPLRVCPWQHKGLSRPCRTALLVSVSGETRTPQASGVARGQPHREIRSPRPAGKTEQAWWQSVCVRARVCVCVRVRVRRVQQ